MYIPNIAPAAWAQVRGGGVAGMVHFYPAEGGTLVSAEIHGLPDSETGFFAFHIHEGASCDAPGGHWNPGDQPHPRHAGDLPPLLSDNGRARMTVLTGRFKPEQVVGKTVIIHSGPDDFHTQPSGNPGKILACGAIHCCELQK